MNTKRTVKPDEAPVEFKEIELLVISPAEDLAHSVQTQLRESGHNVHVSWLDKPENLVDELQRGLPRLICCHDQSGEKELRRLIGLCINIAPSIPVVAVLASLDSTQTEDLLHAGAAQVVSNEHKSLMTRALERELESGTLHEKLKTSRRQNSLLRSQLNAIVAESPEALAYVHDGIHTHLNLSYIKLFGFTEPTELEGVPLMDLVAPQSRDQIKALLNQVSKGDARPEPIEFVAQLADDSNTNLSMRCRPATLEGEDQVEVMVFQEASVSLAPTPTNAFEGRIALYKTLEDIKAQHVKAQQIGIVFICIDELEKLQDRLGLYAIDNIMSEVSFFLLESMADADQSFRFDVGEYVILAARKTTAEVHALAEHIRSAIDKEVFGDDLASSPLTASVSVAFAQANGKNTAALLKAQRTARKTSVRDGNTVVEVITDGANADGADTSDPSWLNRIRAGLEGEGDGLILALLSIASLEGEQRMHSEVQLRMVGDKGEGIQSEEFLPTAQRHGLMPLIDQWIVRETFALLRRKQKDQEQSLLFITLSQACTEDSEAFLAWLKKLKTESKVDTADIALAFDEDTLQFNTKKATTVIKAFKSLGLKIAIHSFGNSANSMQLLDLIGPDYVRLAPSFTQALIASDVDKRVSQTVDSVKSKGAKIIASHVDDANGMARLWQAGVHYVQGSYVQEPGVNNKLEIT